ncbi:hypothetical protein GE061_019876 [Apolygus lucorum]|uniref:CCHC-type domain-containing protein n=1 Tax=Apolygus lucorum TaxID=248454 RepID=A0A8S9X9T8_APOLU|nr:hypothetical protein GE061_019876 [Apolygus lucorum]
MAEVELLKAQLAALKVQLEEAAVANRAYAERLAGAEAEGVLLDRTLNALRRIPEVDPTPRPPRRDLGLQTLIKAWGGGPQDIPVEEYLGRIRTVGRTGNWTPEDHANICRLKLTGAAAAFLEGHATLSREDATFEDQVAGLTARFSDPHMWEVREEELRSCSQKSNESIQEYADRVTRIGKKATRPGENEAETAWLRREGEKQTLRAFVRGLQGKVASMVALEEPRDMATALTRALSIDHTLKTLRVKEKETKRVYTVEEPEEAGEDEEGVYLANQATKGMGRPGRCFGCPCHQPTSNHPTSRVPPIPPRRNPPSPLRTSQNPREETRRCFRCDQEGHMARSCVNPPSFQGPTSSGPLGQRPLVQCFRCDGFGHLARYCPAGPQRLPIEASPNGNGTRIAPSAYPAIQGAPQ